MSEPQTITGLDRLLPDESLAKLATGYGVQRTMILQMTQQHAAEIERLKDEHALAVKGLEARIEALEAEMRAASQTAGSVITAPWASVPPDATNVAEA